MTDKYVAHYRCQKCGDINFILKALFCPRCYRPYHTYDRHMMVMKNQSMLDDFTSLIKGKSLNKLCEDG